MYEPTPTLKSLLHGIEIGMLTTVDLDGSVQSRPMHTQEVDPNGILWCFPSRSSNQVSTEEHALLANVAYALPSKQRYVSVCGRVAVVDDPEKRHELWSESARSWFKDGPDDADLALVRVDIEHVDYWEGPSNVLTRLIGFATATLSGRHAASGERARIEDPFSSDV